MRYTHAGVSLSKLIDNVTSGPDDATKIESIKALAQLALPGDGPSMEALRRASGDPSPAVSFFARRAVDQLTRSSRARSIRDVSDTAPSGEAGLNLERFESYLTYPEDPEVRIRAISLAIDRQAREALPLLLSRLEAETDLFVLSKLAQAVGLLGDAFVVPRLAPFLEHPDSRVRANAVEGLAAIQDEQVFKLLITRLEDPDARVRGNVVKALKGACGFDPVKVLEGMARSATSGDRASALFVLSRMSSIPALEALFPLIDDPDSKIRDSAWTSLLDRANVVGERLLDHLLSVARADPSRRKEILGRLAELEERVDDAMACEVVRAREELDGPAAGSSPVSTTVNSRSPERGESDGSGAAESGEEEPEVPAIGPAFIGIETEFDGLSEADLKSRFDELEKDEPSAALHVLEQAVRSVNRSVRLEARRRLTRVRHLTDAAKRTDERSRQRKTQGALGGIAVLFVSLVLFLVASEVLRRPSRPKPISSVSSPSMEASSPVPDEKPSSAIPSVAASVSVPSARKKRLPAIRPARKEPGRKVVAGGGLVSWALASAGRRILVGRENVTLVYPSPPPNPPADYEPRPTGKRVSRDVFFVDLSTGIETQSTQGVLASAPVPWGEGLAWLAGVQTAGDLVLDDSGGRRPLTEQMAVSSPSRSPDGRWAAVQVNVLSDSGTVLGSDVALIELATTERVTSKRLVHGLGGRYLTMSGRASWPRFSHDSLKVAYLSGESTGVTETTAIHVAEVASSQDLSTSLNGRVTSFSWIPGSGLLLCLVDRETSTDLVSLSGVDPKGPGRTILSRGLGERILDFSVSPSGENLVVVLGPASKGSAPVGDLWLANRDGKLIRALTFDRQNREPAFLPSGKEFCYAKLEGGERSIWIQTLEADPTKK